MAAAQKGEQTRQQIIEAAYNLFLTQGFHATSMRQIATRAEIALGGIYNHFINKGQIFEAVLLEHHPYKEILPALQAAKGNTLEEFVHDMATNLVCGLETHPDFLKLMFIEIVEFNNTHFQQLLLVLVPQVWPVFEKINSFPNQKMRPIPSISMLRSFFGLFFSYYMTSLILKGSPLLPDSGDHQSVDDFVNIFLYGVLDGEKP